MDVLDTSALQRLVSELFPACNSDTMQCESALRVLDYSYFNNANRSRFGGTPMIERLDCPIHYAPRCKEMRHSAGSLRIQCRQD